MNRKLILSSLFIFFCLWNIQAEEYETMSPNGMLKIKLRIDKGTTYEIWHGNEQLIASSPIGLNLSNGMIIGGGTVKNVTRNVVDQTIEVIAGKNKTLREAYNELLISFTEDYDLLVRAYDEGIAYRFITRLGGEIIINSEDAVFNFTFTPTVYFPECDTNYSGEKDQEGKLHQIHQGYRNFERLYKIYNAPTEITNNRFSVSPVLFSHPDTSYKIVVTESDTYDYPGLYMEQNGPNSMRGKWAQYPKEVMDEDPSNPNYWYSNHLVISRENYIAKTEGNRTFPWRVIIVSDDDKSLLNNELVYMLAEPCRLTDTSWIQPGKSAWEWWHKAVLEGVDFPSGNNNLSFQLYKYYVDWASQHGIEYMTLDAGWSESYIRTLCLYAKQKNVKIIVWTWASCVRENPEDWIKKMKDYGVSGAKIDFFERNDQIAMRWGRDFAQRLANHQMVALFHGCPVPAGINRTFPNILNFEAVRGAECNFWEKTLTPEYHTQFPFIRSLVGPEDYTPGSMRNVTQEEFQPIDKDDTPPMSMGTRAHELSMYVIYDQWIGYLCDSPTEYNKYPDILSFLSTVPVVWDKTVPLDAKLGDYILVAKQKGKDWYVGGMTDWTARTLEVDFGFLEAGVSYLADIFKDTSASGEQPKQYVCERMEITKDTKLSIPMAKGGGFAIRLLHASGSGITEVKQENPLIVYVEKETDTLHIKTEKRIEDVRINDITGQTLFARKYNDDVYSERINLSDFNKGIYVVSVKTAPALASTTFIY